MFHDIQIFKLLNKFLQICSISDFLILKYNKFIYIKILPILHVVREYPVNLNRYANIISNRKLKILFLILKSIAAYITRFLNNIFKRRYNFLNVTDCEHTKYDNIFISHLVNENQFESTDDFYFSEMPQISAKNTKTLLVLVNHTGNSFFIKFCNCLVIFTFKFFHNHLHSGVPT